MDWNPNDYFVKCDQGHQHWGAEGAAGLMLHHQDEQGTHRYLMQQRSPWVEHGRTWAPPAGALAPGETPEQGATREATEELGPFQAANHQISHVNDHGGWKFHTVTADTPQMFDPQLNDESSDAAWLTPEEIDEMPLHPGFQESWNDLRPTPPQKLGRDEAPTVFAKSVEASEREETEERSAATHRVAKPDESVKENAASTMGDGSAVGDPSAQILDDLTMKSVAHNIHYKYQQAPLTMQEATEYAARLLDMIGYKNPDEMTISTALNAWHQLYPADKQLEQGPGVQQQFEAPPTVPSNSWGYGTVSSSSHNWQPGSWGKGLTLNGQPHTWSTDGPGGSPHHVQYLSQLGVPQDGFDRAVVDGVVVAPDGSYTLNPGFQSENPVDPSLLARTQPGMRYMPNADKWNMRAFSAVSAPPVPELYHWTDASNLHGWMDEASNGPGSTYLTEHGEAPDDESWNPDVPMMQNPVRLTIDHNQLDPDGWDDTYHGWLNNYLYHGPIPKGAVKGIKAFPPAESWDMPEHWASITKFADYYHVTPTQVIRDDQTQDTGTQADTQEGQEGRSSTEPTPQDAWPEWGELTNEQKHHDLMWGDSGHGLVE